MSADQIKFANIMICACLKISMFSGTAVIHNRNLCQDNFHLVAVKRFCLIYYSSVHIKLFSSTLST